jgi:tRNA modification GTPase
MTARQDSFSSLASLPAPPIRGEAADTIAAVSSAPLAAERAIVRMSGPRAIPVAAELFDPQDGPPPAQLPAWSVVRGTLKLPALASPVPALLYLMRAPRSYTREDVVEFHIVGSPPLAAALLAELTSRQVRLARPGEFTERAYLSGRIDLSQAEAVLKLIHARSDAERRLALGELTGDLSRRTDIIAEHLAEILTRAELSLDFSEDDVPDVSPAGLAAGLAGPASGLDDLLRSGAASQVFAERPRVGIVGRANVGKSSLFNRLLGRDEAIVTDVAGTTRDLLEAELSLDGAELLLVDTAGEKIPAEDLDELALERSHAELQRADLVLLVIDSSAPLTPIDLTLIEKLQPGSPLPPGEGRGLSAVALAKADEGQVFPSPPSGGEGRVRGKSSPSPFLIVLNKTDLPVDGETDRFVRGRGLVVPVSCVTSSGLDRLRDEIRALLTVRGVERAGLRFLFNLRQLDSLRHAREALARASTAAHDGIGLEFAAAEIRTALGHLRDLTHPFTEDEILDRIFSRFCIGK